MIPTVSPVKDFYSYANGAFDQVPIPGEYSTWGVNEEINERTFAVLKNILETSAKTGGPKGSVAQRVGDFYAAGMDEVAIEQAGAKPLLPWFSEIEKITTPVELIEVTAICKQPGSKLDSVLAFRSTTRMQLRPSPRSAKVDSGFRNAITTLERTKTPKTFATHTSRTSPACWNSRARR